MTLIVFYFTTPAPTPPRMFQITSLMTRSLSFSWQAPVTLNGVLSGYQLSCQPLLPGIPPPQTLTPGHSAVVYTLSPLYPGVGYNCSIVARNNVGPSDPVYISGTTLETGTSVYVVCIPCLVLLVYHLHLISHRFNMFQICPCLTVLFDDKVIMHISFWVTLITRRWRLSCSSYWINPRSTIMPFRLANEQY